MKYYFKKHRIKIFFLLVLSLIVFGCSFLIKEVNVKQSASAYNSDFWLINAWYIRLKTVDLGYQLPKTALPKFLDNVRFYVNAYNLLTFTGYDKYQQDPEIKTNTAGDAYMNQRVINFGVQLGF